MTANQLIKELQGLAAHQRGFPVLVWVDGSWRPLESVSVDAEVKTVDLVGEGKKQ